MMWSWGQGGHGNRMAIRIGHQVEQDRKKDEVNMGIGWSWGDHGDKIAIRMG